MKFFSSLKQSAVAFLEPYKTKAPATYAAAEQAIGAVLIADGLVGIDSPFDHNKRPGIFGTIGGMIIGVVCMLTPKFFGNMTGFNDMTATTTATVSAVSSIPNNGTCSMSAAYTVNGVQYDQQSNSTGSDYCSLAKGQQVTINYNPNNPGSWTYGAGKVKTFLQVFFWAGLFALISSIITFFIRLFSIIFGWKLLRDGQKNAAVLPAETNLQSMINEIKQSFTASIFGFGAAQPGDKPVTPSPTQGPVSPKQ